MRYLPVVIDQLISEVPSEEERLICKLKSVRQSASCSAPENMYLWWNRVSDILGDCFGEKPTEEWQFKLASIWTTKSIDEIKSWCTK